MKKNHLVKYIVVLAVVLVCLCLWTSGITLSEILMYLTFMLLGLWGGWLIHKKNWSRNWKFVLYGVVFAVVTFLNWAVYWLRINWLMLGIFMACLVGGLLCIYIAYGQFRIKMIIHPLANLLAALFLIGLSVRFVSIRVEKRMDISRRYEALVANPSVNLCESFLEYRGDFADIYEERVLRIWLDLLSQQVAECDLMAYECGDYEERPLHDLYWFAEENKSNAFGREAHECLLHVRDSLYSVADSMGTLKAWTQYQMVVPIEYWCDAELKKTEIDARLWSQENTAWEAAVDENSIEMYERYLNEYPSGLHAKKAEELLIDLQLSEIYDHPHGTLPFVMPDNSGGGNTTTLKITNGADSELTLFYSGSEKKRVVLPAGVTSTIRLKNGQYRVGAKVQDSETQPSIGAMILNGGNYTISYYLTDSRLCF